MIKKRRVRKGFQERLNDSLRERYGPEAESTIQEKLCEMLGTTHPEINGF